MITIEKIKQANEIKIHIEEKIGYIVVNNKLIPFKLDEIDDIEVTKFIIENGEQVVSSFDILIKNGTIFEYVIHNGGEYEFSHEISLYSSMYFNEEEFSKMCKNAQDAIEKDIKKNNSRLRKDSIYDISVYLKKLNPNIFIKIGRGSTFNSGEWDLD